MPFLYKTPDCQSTTSQSSWNGCRLERVTFWHLKLTFWWGDDSNKINWFHSQPDALKLIMHSIRPEFFTTRMTPCLKLAGCLPSWAANTLPALKSDAVDIHTNRAAECNLANSRVALNNCNCLHLCMRLISTCQLSFEITFHLCQPSTRLSTYQRMTDHRLVLLAIVYPLSWPAISPPHLCPCVCLTMAQFFLWWFCPTCWWTSGATITGNLCPAWSLCGV